MRYLRQVMRYLWWQRVIVLVMFVFSFHFAHAALVPPFMINSVVSLGMEITKSIPGQTPNKEWQTEGTGFFYGHLVHDESGQQAQRYEVYLVTAKHVVTAHLSEGRGELSVRVNSTSSSSAGLKFTISNHPLPGQETWFFHPNPKIDIAAVKINMPELRKRGFQSDFFTSDYTVADSNKLRTLGVAAGDGAFVLGFPLGLAGEQQNYVIVRGATIARISEMLDNASTTYILDALIYPGNSGGPVILRPEAVSIVGTKNQPKAYLIGVALGYHPYTDVAISTQTHHARITFEENSGLAEILPTDYIEEAIIAHESKINPSNYPLPN